MALYTLHLGFNWNSPPIGSIWGTPMPGTCFLQYALTDDTGASHLFKFAETDELAVIVWDLSSSPVQMSLQLSMSLSYLEASETYDPSSYLDVGGDKAVGEKNAQYYFTFASVTGGPQGTSSTSPWGPCTSWYSARVLTKTGNVTFASPITCKLSFRLNGSPSGGGSEPLVFLSDPEVIVGSGK